MKRILLTFLATSLLLLAGCVTTPIEYEDINQENMTIFTKQKTGNIGDVMPFFHNNSWHFFYLHDTAPKPGFHPWYHLSTNNFYEFEDHGETIPVIHNIESQELALGTGSVIEKDGLFYAFYTAHNSRLTPKEKIMLSISNDNMSTWVKQTFVIDPKSFGFDLFDFRDPHVVFVPEKNKYYMLFTTRHLGKGAIGYLISDDLIDWEKEGDGIFFLNNSTTGTTRTDSNLECPTLWFFNGYWYMSFSDQWPDRQTHYIYKKAFSDNWIKPPSNAFDGKGFYAGKVAASEDQMIIGGWVSHDFNRQSEFAWGGNFIAHELKQNPNGTLFVDMITSLKQKINHPQSLTIESSDIDGASTKKIAFTPVPQYETVIFNELNGISIIEGFLDIKSIDGNFGIFFDYREGEASFHYDFNLDAHKLSFYRGDYTLRSSDRLYVSNSFYNNSSQLKFTLLFEEALDADGSIVSLYIDGQMVLTSRMFNLDKVNFGFYALNSDVTISNIRKFK